MKLVLYDGECGFCSASVSFIWKHDPEGRFHFASIQSETGRKILREHGIDEPQLDTFYLVDEGQLYERSSAAARVAKKLEGYGWAGSLLQIIPRPLRDAGYDLVARNRQKLSGKVRCELPPPEVRKRFLDK